MGAESAQDPILSDRIGLVQRAKYGMAHIEYAFVFDAFGLKPGQVSLRLLPCEALQGAEQRQSAEADPPRFKIAGIVTKYRGDYYLLLQKATRHIKDGPMPHELDQILILPSQPDFDTKLSALRLAIVHATRFRIDSEENKQLRNIVEEVMRRGDEAVAEYTEKFDGVKLSAEQFQVSSEDLEKGHKEADKELLESIRGAIDNVRKYQKEIFIGDKNTHAGIKYTPIQRVGICRSFRRRDTKVVFIR
jgi:hypothetical protein